mmetsp:Transcript_57333/g.94811  ORF Transcript_57333/g.94811 Transcript_57333/m.94811 type:complete len:476 (+) Transcript_57333:135-1562(+)
MFSGFDTSRTITASEEATNEEEAVEKELSEPHRERLRKQALIERIHVAVSSGRAEVNLSNSRVGESDAKLLGQLLNDVAAKAAAAAAVLKAADLAAKTAVEMAKPFDQDAFITADLALNAEEVEPGPLPLRSEPRWPNDPLTPPQTPTPSDSTARSDCSGSSTTHSQLHAVTEGFVTADGKRDAAGVRTTLACNSPATTSKGCTTLLLQLNQIGSRGVAYLSSALKRAHSTVEILALQSNPLGDTGAALLGRALAQNRNLRTLGLQQCGIGALGVRHLVKGMHSNESLTELWLLGNRCASDGAHSLAQFIAGGNGALIHLGIESNNIGPEGAQALCAALSRSSCRLRWLRLQHNPLGESGAAALAKALGTNTSLTKLQLRECELGDAGVTQVATSIPKNRSLQHLGLEANGSSVSNARLLTRVLPVHPQLQSISLGMQAGRMLKQHPLKAAGRDAETAADAARRRLAARKAAQPI